MFIERWEKFSKHFRFLFFVLLVITTLLYVLLKVDLDVVILIIFFSWSVVVSGWELESDFSFISALFCLLGIFFSIIFQQVPAGPSSPAENLSILAYFFIIFGIFGKEFELLKLKTFKKTAKDFLFDLFDQEARISYKSLLNEEIKNYFEISIKFVYIFVKLINHIFISVIRWSRREMYLFFVLENQRFKSKINRFFISIKKSKFFEFFSKAIFDWPSIHIFLFILIINNIFVEIKFYKWFFITNYFKEFFNRTGYSVLLTALLILFGTIIYRIFKIHLIKKYKISIKKGNMAIRYLKEMSLIIFGFSSIIDKKNEKRFISENRGKILFLVFPILIFLYSSDYLFNKAREKFEFFPYINSIYTDIASNWGEVYIKGHNFKDLPFQGTVTINGKIQKISQWSDKLIQIEIDPILSNTGELEVINDYGFGRNIKSNVVEFTYFNSAFSTSDLEKRFWDALKEKALKSNYSEDNNSY